VRNDEPTCEELHDRYRDALSDIANLGAENDALRAVLAEYVEMKPGMGIRARARALLAEGK
jgi:hypothetical protein